MDESKYGQHIIKGPFRDIKHYTGTSLLSHKGELNADVCIGYHCLANTDFKADMPHSHNFHELLIFIGGDPTDITDFDGEIEICLGEEQEKHIISSTSVVSIPPGMLHCPLIVRKVDKPIVFLEISLTREWPDISKKKDY
jgi:hypothetical protein